MNVPEACTGSNNSQKILYQNLYQIQLAALLRERQERCTEDKDCKRHTEDLLERKRRKMHREKFFYH